MPIKNPFTGMNTATIQIATKRSHAEAQASPAGSSIGVNSDPDIPNFLYSQSPSVDSPSFTRGLRGVHYGRRFMDTMEEDCDEGQLQPADRNFNLATESAVQQEEALRRYNVRERKDRTACSDEIVATAREELPDARAWQGEPYQESLLCPPFVQVYPMQAQYPGRRVVMDAALTTQEVEYFRTQATDRWFPIFDDEDDDFGCNIVKHPDWDPHPFNDYVIARVCALVRRHFGEERPLFLAGALLTRKRPHPTHTKPHPHVDKIGVGFYDYSAELDLSTFGADFEGGCLAFNDPSKDQVVQARAGRGVLFASGPHNLHSIAPVTSGERKSITIFLTLSGPKLGTIFARERRNCEGRTANWPEGAAWADYSTCGIPPEAVLLRYKVPLRCLCSVRDCGCSKLWRDPFSSHPLGGDDVDIDTPPPANGHRGQGGLLSLFARKNGRP